MDMKSLMVKSIVDKKVLRCTKRLYFGKKCYIIKFEVRGKYMVVQNIKRGKSKRYSTWRQRLKQRHLAMIRYNSKLQNYNFLRLAKKESMYSLNPKWKQRTSNEGFSSNFTLTSVANTHIIPKANNNAFPYYKKEYIGDSCWDEPYWTPHDEEIFPTKLSHPPIVMKATKATQTTSNAKNSPQTTADGHRLKKNTVKRCHTVTQTDVNGLDVKDSSQQTIVTLNSLHHLSSGNTLHKYQQTELLMQSQSIQCRCKHFHIGVQTQGSHHVNSSTQIWVDDINEEQSLSTPLCYKHYNMQCSMQCKYQTCASSDNLLLSSKNSGASEKEAVIYMLSEIGELVLNQNHMLSNNTRLLDQLSEMSLLSKRIEIARLWSKKRKSRKKKQRRSFARRKKLLNKNCNLISRTVQTDLTLIIEAMKVHKATNTSLNNTKSLKKLKFLDKVR